MRKALAESDASLLRRAAHTIKGAVRYFGAQTAFDLALIVETMAHNGEISEASEAVENLKKELDRITPHFAARLTSKSVITEADKLVCP
jgi:HPt (histidine-containing phosphotransfer) domain-containing protein